MIDILLSIINSLISITDSLILIIDYETMIQADILNLGIQHSDILQTVIQ